jgi:23S rRNA (cytosine1962-C5)-methyltransferase
MSFLFADKPAGVTTHTSVNAGSRGSLLENPVDGFKEYLEVREGGALFVVHRLDRETTGAICFARSSDAAARLIELFKERRVKKTYFFLTDHASDSSEIVYDSYIERRGAEFVSVPATEDQPANARTRFFFERDGLWRAEPETGKSHQIRLHAQACGIPILGDREHGGSSYPALCLHSAKIEFTLDGETFLHESSLPRWFQDVRLAKNHRLVRWLAAVDRRERLLRSVTNFSPETLRWIHSEGDPLRAELLGEVKSLSWFAENLSDAEWNDLHELCKILGWKNWYLQVRGNRGAAPNGETVRVAEGAHLPERWTARENGIEFQFRRDSGLSPGLFLDQRRNREWVRKNAAGLEVLNLFSYTGGFSVCAALAGAKRVVSVDVSKTFLEWTKNNFELNHLTLDPHEFRAIDSRDYLDWAVKKGLKFDLVICDPPSFGRSKSGVFKIESDFETLFARLLSILRPGGRLLFSTNFEKWDFETLLKRARNACRHVSRSQIRFERTPDADWDFELPRAQKNGTTNMKSFFAIMEN